MLVFKLNVFGYYMFENIFLKYATIHMKKEIHLTSFNIVLKFMYVTYKKLYYITY